MFDLLNRLYRIEMDRGNMVGMPRLDLQNDFDMIQLTIQFYI